MNSWEQIIYFLQGEMVRPEIYGWFHLLWIISSIIVLILLLCFGKNKEKKLKIILFVYGFGALILEILKQIIWSFDYDMVNNIVSWDYNWYAFPFQLCTTPIFASIICLFVKKGKAREMILSYMAYITILGSLATYLYPESCFVKTILVNIHTMYLHCGSLVVSLYLLLSGEVEVKFKNVVNGYIIFLFFAFLAEIMNIVMYQSGILGSESFNMFYISPYFISSLPLFDIIQKNTPFIIFLLIYLLSILLGALVIYGVSKFISKFIKK